VSTTAVRGRFDPDRVAVSLNLGRYMQAVDFDNLDKYESAEAPTGTVV